ncbi:MAG TPA: YdcF family protein [Pyrinomonadaceae bacterium]|nr:YdcF family protein [Pyrinomonadaceae bacterium]
MKFKSLLTRLLIFVITIFISLLVYFSYQFLTIRASNNVAEVEKSDCIVVLGAAVWEKGRPSPVFGDRLLRAAELYKAGTAKKIIVSGGLGTNPPEEAEAGRLFLIENGVSDTDIIREKQGMTTAEQADRVREICERENFKSVALVTSFFHEKRAMQIFENAGLADVRGARCTHTRFQDINKWISREAIALAVMNWWIGILSGLVLGGIWTFLRRRN